MAARLEAAPERAERGAAVLVGKAADEGVQRIGIGPDYVPDIGDALEPAFDLERIGPGLGEVLQAMDEVEVLQGKQGLIPDQHPAAGILQVVQRPAGLHAGPAVRAPACQMLREIALPAIAHAESPVDKAFQFGIDGRPDGADLFQGQFPLQDEPAIAEALGETRLLRRADGALGGGMEDHPFRSEPRHGRILHDQRVHAGFLQFLQQPPGLRNLLLVHQRIESHVDADAEPVRIVTKPADVRHGVPGRLPRPEGRSGEIDGIGPAVDGRDADVRRPGGGQEFEISPLRLRLRSK